jgi:hypothetical protein
MTVQERIVYAKLIIALSRDDKDEVIRLYTQEMGYATKRGDPHLAYLHACFYNDRSTPDITQGKNVHLFLEWLQGQDPVVHLPEEYIMAGRLSLLLRGMAMAFGLHIRLSEVWKPEAERFLKSQGIDY